MGVNQVSWLIPGRWGYAAVASTSDLGRIMPVPNSLYNSLWNHQGSTWLIDIGGMVVLSIVCALVAWWRLNRLSPGRRK